MDVTLYRCGHNLRAATTLGVVGASGLGLGLGLGLAIITAFHLFECREASALILLLLALVSLINIFGGKIRSAFLGKTDY